MRKGRALVVKDMLPTCSTLSVGKGVTVQKWPFLSPYESIHFLTPSWIPASFQSMPLSAAMLHRWQQWWVQPQRIIMFGFHSVSHVPLCGSHEQFWICKHEVSFILDSSSSKNPSLDFFLLHFVCWISTSDDSEQFQEVTHCAAFINDDNKSVKFMCDHQHLCDNVTDPNGVNPDVSHYHQLHCIYILKIWA